jgi:hypothetical protein
MSIFSVSAPVTNTKIGPAIESRFAGNFIQAWQGQWFVSTTGTTKEIADQLNVGDPTIGTVIVVVVANYWGRANPEVWEWLKSRLETK